MVANKDSLTFGRYLKAARLEKEIDLENVSAETKIGMYYLLLIEKEDHDTPKGSNDSKVNSLADLKKK